MEWEAEEMVEGVNMLRILPPSKPERYRGGSLRGVMA